MKSSTVQSLYKTLERTNFKFYCVSCHKERHLAAPAKVGSKMFYFHVATTSAFIMAILWHWFAWKGIVVTVPILAAFEILYRLKMRAALACPDCSFDPILYLVDREKAVRQVEDVWMKKFEQRGLPYPERRRPVLSQGKATSVASVTPVASIAPTVSAAPTAAVMPEKNILEKSEQTT